ncbi:hypothetical protein PIB30_004778 [Stylosanthes scabra]|uniref:Uncharacterized protein n=1 Tax=Stylosanthes scabra TaxID=79078 RepID=A0ABU6T428_9FABA|nr:hypothetical protein [Stylosanthes scabra]
MIPPQFEVVSVKDAASDPNGKKSSDEAAAKGAEKQDGSFGSTILQESENFLEWSQNDCALMTWLDASMTMSYKNQLVHCATFAEGWELLSHIFTTSSSTRIQIKA